MALSYILLKVSLHAGEGEELPEVSWKLLASNLKDSRAADRWLQENGRQEVSLGGHRNYAFGQIFIGDLVSNEMVLNKEAKGSYYGSLTLELKIEEFETIEQAVQFFTN